MRPIFKITIDKVELSKDIQNLIKSIKITDDVGFLADTVSVQIADPYGDLAIPRTGVMMEVAMGYDGESLSFMGQYFIDEVSVSPGEILVSGKSFDTNDAVKAKRGRDFKTKNLGKIIRTIAKENYLEANVNQVFDTMNLEKSLIQRNESDLHLLTKLSKTYHGVFKIQGNKLFFTLKDSGTTIAGDEIKPILIKGSEKITWEAQLTGRSLYKKVKAKYLSIDKKNIETIEIGEGEPVLELDVVFNDLSKAELEASSRLNGSGYISKSLSITMPGRTELRSESVVDVVGFRNGIDGRWLVLKAQHSIDNGFVTTIECQKSLGVDKPPEIGKILKKVKVKEKEKRPWEE